MLSHGGYRGCLGPGCGPLAGAGYCLRTLACRLERLRPGRTTRVHRCDHAMRSRTRRRVNGVLARALWMRAHADRVVQPKALDPVRAQNCFLVALFQKASNLARGVSRSGRNRPVIRKRSGAHLADGPGGAAGLWPLAQYSRDSVASPSCLLSFDCMLSFSQCSNGLRGRCSSLQSGTGVGARGDLGREGGLGPLVGGGDACAGARGGDDARNGLEDPERLARR